MDFSRLQNEQTEQILNKLVKTYFKLTERWLETF